MSREIKFRYQLKLVSDDWGRYKEGEIGTFYFSLNDKQNGLYRFSIDERWEVVSCDEWTGLKDCNDVDIYENDLVEHIIESEYLDKADWDTITDNVILINGCWCVGAEQYPLFAFKNEVLSDSN